jgi:hypothetical protein
MGELTGVMPALDANKPPVGKGATVLSANVPVAVNCCVLPKAIEGFAGVTTIAVSGLFTPWIRKGEVLGLMLASPLYTAVTTCSPGVRADVEELAAPLDKLIGEPKLTPSIANCTFPSGTGSDPPEGEYITVAVKVTEPLKVEGSCEEATATVAEAGVMAMPALALPPV